MEGFQITSPGAIEKIEKIELFENVSSLKIKITKLLFTEEDFNTFKGNDAKVKYPIIPGRTAVGKVAEISQDNVYDLKKGDSVFLHSVSSCGKCYQCTKGNYKRCVDFQIAGKNVDGYLKNFAVKSFDDISSLPAAVSEDMAVFISHVAVADSIIDNINLQKGEHVVIVGADLMGIILAQLIIYYQGVPILVDTNVNNLKIAEDCGVYYTQFVDNKIEKYISDLTSTRMAKKVVYMTGSNINTDIAIKLASHYATVCFAGFGTPNIRVNFNLALQKQLQFKCVTNGFDNINSAINILANNVIDVKNFKIETVKIGKDTPNVIKAKAEAKSNNCCDDLLIIKID